MKTSGRSIAPVAKTTSLALTCQSRSRGRFAGGLLRWSVTRSFNPTKLCGYQPKAVVRERSLTLGLFRNFSIAERAQSGADLDDVVARPDPGEVGDATDGVRIGDEVLPEIPARSETPGGQEVTHRGARQGHPAWISTGTGAVTRSAISMNRSGLSTSSSPSAGWATHSIERPLAGLTTLTVVPAETPLNGQLSPLVTDRLCYAVTPDGNWKIVGFDQAQ